VNLLAKRGERIAILGANGNGKTTLLKLLGGELRPTEGQIRAGHNAKVGYYAQHVTERLDLRSTVFDEVWRGSEVEDLTQVRNALGTMLFSGDDVDKVVGVLSGGEKARVALAKLLVSPGNVILMDEPTNHLDLESSEALAAALETFGGTLLFVSHNRSYVPHLASRSWNEENGRVEDYPGTFDDYMERTRPLERERERAVADGVGEPEARASATVPSTATQAKADRPAKTAKAGAAEAESRAGDERAPAKRGNKNSRAVERKIADLESRIAALEKVQAERSAELSRPETYADRDRYGELLSAYQSDAAKLEELIARWERTQAELMG
jgi:ATP-binding cassette subfamily F protein 3